MTVIAGTPELMFDGWYTRRRDTEELLAFVADHGARPVGLVESAYRTWGVLYVSSEVLFENHRLSEWYPDWLAPS